MKFPPWTRRGPLAAMGAAFGFAAIFGSAVLRHVLREMMRASGQLSHVATDEVVTFAYFATAAALALSVFGFVAGTAIERLTAAAVVDPLTRVANRRGFEARLEREVERAAEAAVPLSLLVIDVDHMKDINDRHGHAAGDDALHRVAEAIVQSCRTRDFIGRWGGDEFVVLLPRTRAVEAIRVAERIHDAVVAGSRGDPDELSVSIGIAEYAGTHPLPPPALFEGADRALYRAKEAGRGRTSVAPSSEVSGSYVIPPAPARDDAATGSRTRLRAARAEARGNTLRMTPSTKRP